MFSNFNFKQFCLIPFLQIVTELGYDMSVQDFSDMIKNDPKNFYDNPEDLLDTFKEYVYDKIFPLLSEVVFQVPKTKLE